MELWASPPASCFCFEGGDPREMRRVKTGLWDPPDSEIWTVSFWSLDFRAPEGVTRTRTLGREVRELEPFPPSKYSIRREVWEFCAGDSLEEPSLSRRWRWRGIVTAFPSSGMEYDVLSVRREMSVSRSVGVTLVPTRESVGAGRIGLRESTPIT